MNISYRISLSLVFVLFACQKKAEQKTTLAQEVIAVKPAPVQRASSAEPIKASGLVSSETEAALSFKTQGIIQQIYVKEGQPVHKGQLLASLNLTEINAQVQQASESVSKAERDLGRVTNLYRDSVATYEQVQNLTTALNFTRNNLEIAQYNRSFSEIRATVNGVVVKKFMNEGELASPGRQVFQINATGPKDWVIKVGVADKDWIRLKIGDKAQVRFDAYPDQDFPATVSNLSAGSDQASGLYQVELKITTNVPRLATGIFANTLLYPSVQHSLSSIPVEALIEGTNQDGFVYVKNGDKARKVPVKVAYLNKDQVFIQNGLEGINEVITDGSAYLTDGVTIKQ
ncbi:MAG: efflux RND transporter periplasmic adaptor subunit [Siphonobacter sp.]